MICSGGGGDSMSPLSPLLRGLFQLLVVVACPSSSCSGLGVSRFSVFITFLLFILFVYFLYLCCACPSLNCPVGLSFWTHDMMSDCLSSGIPPRLFQDSCRLVLTCSHDSLFLWYPAIDIVWLGPVFLALGSLSHLALCSSAW